MSTTAGVTAGQDALIAPTRARVPLNAFSIGFGVAGLAGTWTQASHSLGAPQVVAEILWLAAAATWVISIGLYLVRSESVQQVGRDMGDPTLGPFASLVPATGMLLAGHLYATVPRAGKPMVVAMAIAALAFAAWFIAQLLTVPRAMEAVHGGYFLPVVAAPFIAAQVLAVARLGSLALAMFGVGVVCWMLMGGALLARLMNGPPVPGKLLPTLAIFAAPPAVGGNACWAMTDGHPGAVGTVLVGLMVAVVTPNLYLIRRYLSQPFGIGFWAFTFTTAATATFSVRMLSTTTGTGVVFSAWLAVTLATLLIAAIAVRSIVMWSPWRRRRWSQPAGQH